MSFRQDLASFEISRENIFIFINGREITEPIPKNWEVVPHQDTIHCICDEFSGYAEVIKVNDDGTFVLKRTFV